MASILALAGSNSSTSINFKLVKHTASLVQNHEIQLLDMSKYPFPMFSEDLEKESGYSNALVELKNDFQKADAVILSVNEHNGNPSAYFKNVLDWLSRVDRKFLEGTKILLMSAAPGKRGGIGSIGVVNDMLPRFGGEVLATFSLPSFKENFNEKDGIVENSLKEAHSQALETFLNELK